MKFEVGDKVVVRITNEDGEVVEILSDKMVMVDVRGVRFPAYTDQLDFPYFKRFSQKKVMPEKPAAPKTYIDQVPKEKIKDLPRKAPNGVWLTFIPSYETDEFGDDIVTQLKIHLHNQNNEGYGFRYQLKYFGNTDFELKNEVLAFQDFYMHDIPFSHLNDSPAWYFEFSLLQADKKKAPYFEASLKLKPKQVFQKVQEIQAKGEPFFSYQLFKQYPDKVEEDTVELGRLAAAGFKIYDASKARQHLPPARTVVDLHIEKLTDAWKDMSNQEILQLQVETFEKYYELALAHRQPMLTIIHGVGSGRLRDEVHDILRHRKPVKSFVNQYDPRYGYGATEIYFNT
ncbi:Smr/MutS family protein [Flavihumibacter petaseus]|uniref:Smr domain-containing protein n=1 Tax=Flavihumibacter petaseus NBRC 106054 TaxID=1220578 RepID=A0A0E9N478_9BACT|nr:Smr/MutS family protein [Flavihumibacter petaseus]GAO44593.1 hypothetical protein FPE01S_03_06310 [Flavihumibacter petaseus NBRC 106054]